VPLVPLKMSSLESVVDGTVQQSTQTSDGGY